MLNAPHSQPGPRVRRLLDQRRAPLFERVSKLADDPGGAERVGLVLGQEHAQVLDELVIEAFSGAQAAARGSSQLALAGVGGYGRGAVALGADLDVRLLAAEPKGAQQLTEALLYPLWDAGLTLGHQVVTPDELLAAAQGDLPSATSLLDWRFVAGDRRFSDQLLQRAAGELFALAELPKLFSRLEAEVQERHARFGGSVYMLEPDVKNGRGALRDLDVAWWVVRARWQLNDFAGLVPLGVLMPRQLAAVQEARELLWRIRNVLHAQARRRSDRLGFDDQEAAAVLLGYLPVAEVEPSDAALRVAVERMMSEYYRAARTVARFRDLIVARATPVARRQPPRSEDVGEGLQLLGGEATFLRPDLLQDDPAAALRIFDLAVEREVPLRPSARGQIVDGCGDEAWCARLRADPEAVRRFVALVTSCKKTQLKRATVMRELHDVGLLLAMVPEFSPVVGRVHHDTYHVYTVDVHSVAAVDRLVEMVRQDVPPDEAESPAWVGPLACRLAKELRARRVLFFAALLHDIGKAIGRRDHSERGAEMARVILARLGFGGEEVERVARLIEHHLTMYLMATRRDLDDPATAAELARLVGDREGLLHLYLLTVADLSTTSPTSMTSWKARMLDQLYMATEPYLAGDGAPESASSREAEVLEGLDDERRRAFVRRFLRAMPERYLLAHDSDAVALHAQLVQRHLAGDAPVSLAWLLQPSLGAVEICVVTRDRPGLLADIAAALTASRLMVHAAQIYSCVIERPGQAPMALAVDVFWVHHSGGLEEVEAALAGVESRLSAVLRGEAPAEEMVREGRGSRRRGRSVPRVESRVVVDQQASPLHTVVEVTTLDRPGLLFQLSHALHQLGLSIAVAKIATEGTRVVDVFYVSEPDGKKVTIPARVEAIERALVERIEGLDAIDHGGGQ